MDIKRLLTQESIEWVEEWAHKNNMGIEQAIADIINTMTNTKNGDEK